MGVKLNAVTLMKEHAMRVFETMVLRGTSGPEKVELRGHAVV
jgi:hypothetical protein